MRKHGWISFGSLLLIIFLAIGCASAKGAYNDAVRSDTPAAYENFLKNYPGSEFTEDAKQKLENAKAKQAAEKAERERQRKEVEDRVRKLSESGAKTWTIRSKNAGIITLAQGMSLDDIETLIGGISIFKQDCSTPLTIKSSVGLTFRFKSGCKLIGISPN